MTDTSAELPTNPGYAMGIADGSYNWYRTAAIRSRRWYHVSEILIVVFSAAIPATAAIVPHTATAPAVLGAIVVIVSGCRAIFTGRLTT